MEDAALVRAAQRFLEGKRELAAASKLVAIKRATLLLPVRQEGILVEGQALVRSWLVVESKEDKEESTHMMPFTRAK